MRIPILDLVDGRHLIEAIGKVVKLLDAMCEADRQLFGKELGSSEKCS